MTNNGCSDKESSWRHRGPSQAKGMEAARAWAGDHVYSWLQTRRRPRLPWPLLVPFADDEMGQEGSRREQGSDYATCFARALKQRADWQAVRSHRRDNSQSPTNGPWGRTIVIPQFSQHSWN